MSSTIVPFGDPKAQKRWSAILAVEAMLLALRPQSS